jgi:hypothetical protein
MHALHQSIPIKVRDNSDVHRAKLIGTGLGWFVRDYRGRKIVQHGGGWGAEMAFVPEEDLAVVVLSNLDDNGLVWMLPYDLIDAYLVGPEYAWSKGNKWDYWLRLGGPGHMDVVRNEQMEQLKKDRIADNPPSVPLEQFAGKYNSKLYGILEVRHNDRGLSVQFGDHAAELSHWQKDEFLGHAVVEPFLDWLVKFQVAGDGSVNELEVVSVGWKDPDEQHFFQRVTLECGDASPLSIP